MNKFELFTMIFYVWTPSGTNYTQAQIAEDLGWNVNTVKYRMQGSYNMM